MAVLLVLLAAAAAPASGGGGEVPGVGTVVVGELLGETSERYASWNVDMSFNRGFSHINFTNPNLIAAAASLRPSTLRCGGTGNDYQHYALGNANVPCPAPANDTDFWGCVNATHWDNFYDFSVAAGADMLLGVSFDNDAACAAGPDYAFDPAPHGVTGLLEHLAARGQRVWGFELGNEINNLNDPAKPSGGCKLEPRAQAAGLRRLREAVEEVGLPQRPVFVGPDTGYFACHGQRGAECPWLAGYLEDMRDAGALGMLHAVTHHVYAGITAENFNSPKQLAKAQADPEWYLPIVRRFEAPGGGAPLAVWAGENGPKAGGEDGTCGAASVCGAFGSALWYADELGRRAQWGYVQHQRQDLLGGRYGLVHIPHGNEALGPADPVALTPDWWVNFFWKRTMGRRAHNATALPAGFGGGLVRAYVHRGPPPSPDAPPELRRRPADAWSAVLINLSSNATFAVRLAEGAGARAPRVVSWTLTPEAGSGLAARALANGRPLPAGIADGAAIAGVPVPGAATRGGAPLRLPPLSVTFAAAV